MASKIVTPNTTRSNSERADALDSAELAKKEEEVPGSSPTQKKSKNSSSAESAQFNLLATELPETEEEAVGYGQEDDYAGGASHHGSSRLSALFGTFLYRMSYYHPGINEDDPYFDYSEEYATNIHRYGKEVRIPTLKECHRSMESKQVQEIQAYRQKSLHVSRRFMDTFLSIAASVYIYLLNMIGIEAAIVILNSAAATTFFCRYASIFAVKLDFSFLAFSVVFPLTFLLQSNFSHRDEAVKTVADFNANVLNTALCTLTVDFPAKNGNPAGGRLSLPENFDAQVVKDYRELIQLVYEYLSMPTVGYTRYVAFTIKDKVSKRVHALQNDIVKRIRRTFFDFSMHTETLRSYGLASAEASRLCGLHSTLESGFEHLRILKTYRTPQATRSFGRAYLLILPWISGPYFAWVSEDTNLTYSIILSCFTFLIVYGLLITQHDLEDPFVSDSRSWAPGIDNCKLGFEMAAALQGLEQYYENAELRRSWELARSNAKKQQSASRVED